jgi:hypothetical protein
MAHEIYEVRVTVREVFARIAAWNLLSPLSWKDILDSGGYVCAYEHAIRFDDNRF